MELVTEIMKLILPQCSSLPARMLIMEDLSNGDRLLEEAIIRKVRKGRKAMTPEV